MLKKSVCKNDVSALATFSHTLSDTSSMKFYDQLFRWNSVTVLNETVFLSLLKIFFFSYNVFALRERRVVIRFYLSHRPGEGM